MSLRYIFGSRGIIILHMSPDTPQVSPAVRHMWRTVAYEAQTDWARRVRSLLCACEARCQGAQRRGQETWAHCFCICTWGCLKVDVRPPRSAGSLCFAAQQEKFGLSPEARERGLLMWICCLNHCGTEAGWVLSREPAATGGVDTGMGGRSAGFLSLFGHQKTK